MTAFITGMIVDWVKVGTQVKCVNAFDLSLDTHTYTVQPGREAEIIAVENAVVRVGWFNWFDREDGAHDGFIECLRGDFTYFWEPVGEPPPPRRRPKRSMLGRRHPSQPGSKLKEKTIGFWAASADPDADEYEAQGVFLPWPQDHVDLSWSPEERRIVAEYVQSAPKVNHWMGYSWCRFKCGHGDMGTSDQSDGTYLWPEGFAHYLLVHGVKPDQQFINHVLGRSHV